MSVTIQAKAFQDALKRLVPALDDNKSVSIQTVGRVGRVGKVVLQAGNAALQAEISVPIDAWDERFTVVLAHRQLANLEKLAGDTVTLSVKNSLSAAASKGRGRLNVDVVNQPSITPFGFVTGVEVKVEGSWFAEMIPAASDDSSYRPILSTVAIVGTDLVATDSYRLYVARFAEPILPDYEPRMSSNGALIPLTFAKLLTAAREPIRLTVAADLVQAEFGNEAWSGHLTSGSFPDYNALIPQDPPVSVTFDRAQFDDALKMIKRVAPAREVMPVQIAGNGENLTLTYKCGTVNLEVDTPGTSVETIPGEKVGRKKPVDRFEPWGKVVAFNPAYLTELVAGTTADRVSGIDQTKPWVLRDQADGFERIRVLMPVRV